MATIERRVHLEAAPIRVASELARSPWRSALRIEPVGAGSRVEIVAAIEPDELATAVEGMALAEVCQLKARLEGRPERRRTNSTNNTTTTNWKTRRRTMTTITQKVTIDAPAERVWPALADFGSVSVWNPNVKASRLTSEADSGAGMTRECRLLPVGTVQERVREWVDGRMMTIDIVDFKNVPAMRSAVAVIDLEPQGERTTVTLDMTYEVGLGALGAGMNSAMMKRQFSRSVTGLLAGLKHHVETGQPVDRRSDIPTGAVAAA